MTHLAWQTPATYPRMSALDPQPWMADAVCATVDPAIFHPDKGQPWHARDARKVCEACPVTEACLAYGLDDPHGIYAGTVPAEREKLRAAFVRPELPHGHPSRYMGTSRYEPCRCDECLVGYRAYRRKLKARRAS